LLSASAAAGVQLAGFEALAEVMGCTVRGVSLQGYAGCGVVPGNLGPDAIFGPLPTTESRDIRWTTFHPYADGVRGGFRTALSRLQEEVAALGADGVVGIRLTRNKLDNAEEFSALGTAVRSRSRVSPASPFTTHLNGSDVAKLILNGWVPASLLVGFEVAIRHDDWRTREQAGSWLNVEISGYSETGRQARRAVRTDIHDQLLRLGAEGFIASTITLKIFEINVAEGHRDRAGEALMIGTALAQFADSQVVESRRSQRSLADGQKALSVLPLRDLGQGKRGR
jgi:uncharacterized protein YbjQ (UPF0145 family)